MKKQIVSILLYTNLCETNGANEKVSAGKFRKDIQTLLNQGYTSVRLSDLTLNNEALPQKSFCIVLSGGYVSHYEIAFPILRETNTFAACFLPDELAGKTSYPGIEKFIPHFGWEEASEMRRSGLVDIYGLWHPFDSGKDMKTEVRRKADFIRSHVENCNAQSFFSFPSNTADEQIQKALRESSMNGYLLYYMNYNQVKEDSGAIPYITVNEESNILNVVDSFGYKCSTAVERDKSVSMSDNLIIPEWNCSSDSVILPIDEDPPARNLLRHAIPLSVIGADRRDKAEMIVINNYIEVVFRPWYHFFDYDNHLYLAWPELICNRIMDDLFREMSGCIADYVVNGLKCGYYSDLWLDEYYIPGKGGYHYHHLSHNVLIYGYEKEQNRFLAISYTDSGHFSKFTVLPEDLIRACSNNYFLSVQMIKNNPEAQVGYNDALITEKLRRYLESGYELANDTKDSHYDSNQLCNYNACLAYPDYLKKTADNEHRIYLVALYGYLEHKRLMGIRLELIAQNRGWDTAEFTNYKVYSEQTTERIKLLGMKYQRTGSEKTIQHMIELIKELNAKEKEMILKLL